MSLPKQGNEWGALKGLSVPTITDLKPQRRASYINVMVDGEFVCGLSDFQVAARGLHVGDELSAEDIESLKTQSIEAKAYASSLRYLSYRIRSTGELSDYLRKKEFSSSVIQSIIKKLTDEKYLDDEDFTNRWIRMRMDQNRSLATIRVELMKKNINSSTIQEALAHIGGEETKSQIARLVQKKRQQYPAPEKLIQYLLRKGFRYSDIKQVLEDNG